LQIEGKSKVQSRCMGTGSLWDGRAQLHSEVKCAGSRGKIWPPSGNLRAKEAGRNQEGRRGIGDITTTRISIEDGAYFKGHIEIERAKSKSESKSEVQSEHAQTPVAYQLSAGPRTPAPSSCARGVALLVAEKATAGKRCQRKVEMSVFGHLEMSASRVFSTRCSAARGRWQKRRGSATSASVQPAFDLYRGSAKPAHTCFPR